MITTEFFCDTLGGDWEPGFAAILGRRSNVDADSRDLYDEAGLCFGGAAFPEMRAKSTDFTAQLCVSDRRRHDADSIRVGVRELSPQIARRFGALPATPKTHLSPFCWHENRAYKFGRGDGS